MYIYFNISAGATSRADGKFFKNFIANIKAPQQLCSALKTQMRRPTEIWTRFSPFYRMIRGFLRFDKLVFKIRFRHSVADRSAAEIAAAKPSYTIKFMNMPSTPL